MKFILSVMQLFERDDGAQIQYDELCQHLVMARKRAVGTSDVIEVGEPLGCSLTTVRPAGKEGNAQLYELNPSGSPHPSFTRCVGSWFGGIHAIPAQ